VLALLAVATTTATTTAAVGGVPDVTGAGTPNGTVTLAAIRQANPGTVVTAAALPSRGLNRGYLVVAPAHVLGPLPVLLVLHGSSASATQELQRDEFGPLAQQGKAILVYPAGYGEFWNVQADGCCGAAASKGVDDVEFVAQVLQAVRATYQVGSVDLVGFSNGGKLADLLMCRQPQLFSAVAVVAAVPLTSCSGPPASMLIAIGSADGSLPLETAPAAVPAAVPAQSLLDSAVATWRARDGCTADVTSDTIGTATLSHWTSCAAGTQVTELAYAGLGHNWPDGPLVGVTESAATFIWAFFSGLASTSG
jgi:polyhydroxybutyrate depolymerase